MTSFITFGFILLLLGIAIRLLLIITEDNKTIDFLYANNSFKHNSRKNMEKVKYVLSIIICILGLISIAIGLILKNV